MGFLDNLENNLKSLESREEMQDAREQEKRAAGRARALAAAPWAGRLKDSPFTQDLLAQATRIGFSRRLKVRMSWIGTTLRLEAGERRLDLEPGPDGVTAHSFEGQRPLDSVLVDLDSPAEALARQWLD